jgi:hypothetical protein
VARRMDPCYKNRGARASFTGVLNDSLVHLRLWGLPMPPFIGQAILLCFILLLATPTWAQTQTSDLIDWGRWQNDQS